MLDAEMINAKLIDVLFSRLRVILATDAKEIFLLARWTSIIEILK
jgi:hypothetical protein